MTSKDCWCKMELYNRILKSLFHFISTSFRVVGSFEGSLFFCPQKYIPSNNLEFNQGVCSKDKQKIKDRVSDFAPLERVEIRYSLKDTTFKCWQIKSMN